MNCDVIVDLQFGSVGKGKLVQYLVQERDYDASVRVQSIQAGHTVIYEGKTYKMQTIPCAWVDPNVRLILGPGIFIRPDILLREIEWIKEATGQDPRDRMLVDYRATYINEDDRQMELDFKMTKSMGSTSEGAGASLIRKLWRGAAGPVERVGDNGWMMQQGISIGDTIAELQDSDVLLEGCQGTLLGVHTTPYYPYCTSRECSVTYMLSEAGFAHSDVRDVFGMFRTFPIRVGGDSGPTGAAEISWEELSEYCGKKIEPERTTVTNRERRLFEFSITDLDHAIMINKPTHLVLNFINYINAEDEGVMNWYALSPKSQKWVLNLENLLGRCINLIGTSAEPDAWIRR